MTDMFERDEMPTLEVAVFRDGELVHKELCETEQQAALVAETWTGENGFTYEVTDLSAPDPPVGDPFEVDPADLDDGEFEE